MENSSSATLPLLFTSVRRFAVCLVAASAALCNIRAPAAGAEWNPTKTTMIHGVPVEDLTINGRAYDLFVKAMNERKYALLFYWGPFGHADNHLLIEKVNDLVNSFDWLNVKRNEAYPVFTNASGNSKLLWPDNLQSTSVGQVNAFFRWRVLRDTMDKLEMSLFLVACGGSENHIRHPEGNDS
jgi:hypothetical protein